MSDYAVIVIAVLVLNIGVALLARSRGKSPIAWFFLSWLITPILAAPILLLATRPDGSAR